MRRRRVAVLGGTFDPVHFGHLAIAEQAADLLGAAETWLLPARRPPHRPPPVASAADRLAMVEAAVRGRPRLRVCDVELRRPGPSYTVDTLRELEEAYPDTDVWLVLGADAAREVPTWHRAGELLARGHFLLVNRSGVPPLDVAEVRSLGFPEDHVLLGHVSSPPISATDVRRRAAAGEDVGDLVPPAVADLIGSRGLYR